jgi:2-C-methyl-D-erythritol 4-phosphate cytidylyltransferase/2-C-methyl-D-erythritol 2,4-cyclodiphosphate synthase
MVEASKTGEQTHALIVAAGAGVRAGLSLPKQFQMIRGKAMVRHSLESFESHGDIDRIWIVITAGEEGRLRTVLSPLTSFRPVIGGATRQESVYKGLKAIEEAGGAKIVLVHDAARPFLPHAVIDRLLHQLASSDGAIPVLPTVDTTVRLRDKAMDQIVDRNSLWRVQTPQAFDFSKLIAAHQQYSTQRDTSDDAQLFGAAGHVVTVVEGDERLKIYTLPTDFGSKEGQAMHQVRTGMGYDVHRLAEGEELWLGGVKIDHEKGLSGHSDADVLLHALTDALLGTIAAGDIGDHFPPSDPQWRGVASGRFVEHAVSLIREKGGLIHNVDMTVICEAPKIKPHREKIREVIAGLLAIDIDRVSIKATTTEALGFTGRREGIAAQAVATVSLEEN